MKQLFNKTHYFSSYGVPFGLEVVLYRQALPSIIYSLDWYIDLQAVALRARNIVRVGFFAWSMGTWKKIK